MHTVEVLRLSLEGGFTLDGAIANTLDLDINQCFKTRLRKWLKQVKEGGDIAAAARREGLGNAVAWAFDSKLNGQDTPAVLRMLEEFYRWNYGYCVNLARFVIWPLIVVFLGLIVGFVAYAIFAPMVAIIGAMAGQVLP